ncbi:lipopolysaccharide biosynthesis protein [Kineococcus glutinatus]
MLYVLVGSLPIASGALVSPFLAHILGPREFGAYASALALYQLVVILGTLGLEKAVLLQRVQDGDDLRARGLLALGVLAAWVVAGAVLLAKPWWSPALGFGDQGELAVITVLWAASGASGQVLVALLLAEDRLSSYAFANLLAAVGSQVTGVLLAAWWSPTAVAYFTGALVCQSLAVVHSLFTTRPRLYGLVDVRVAQRALAVGLPLMLGALSLVVLNLGDRFLIVRTLGQVEVGRYQIAYTVGYVVLILVLLTGSAWNPRIVAVADVSRRWVLSGRSRDALYDLLVPVVLGVTLAGPVLLRIMAPSSFRTDGLVVVVFVVALGAYPVAAAGASERLLLSERRTRPLAAAAAAAAAANVVLNLVFIPSWGLLGSALATLVAFALQAAIQRAALPKTHTLPAPPPYVVIRVVAGAALCGASLLLPDSAPARWGTFAAAVAVCLPWFAIKLRTASRDVG